MESVLVDAAGRRRSPATLPGYHCGRPPRNKGLRCPADPPSVEEIVAVMRCAGERAEGLLLREEARKTGQTPSHGRPLGDGHRLKAGVGSRLALNKMSHFRRSRVTHP